MSILIFNRNVLGKPHSYRDWLNDTDEPIVLFTEVEQPDAAGYDHVEHIESFDRNAWTEVRALELDSEFHFKHIVVHSEYDLIRAARLREHLGLPGQDLKSAVAYRDKVVMKEHLCAANIKTAHFRRVESSIDIYQFALERGFPIVIKPVDAGGARQVRIVHDMAELRNYLTSLPIGLPQGFMVESFISGCMYHADGLAENGRVLFSSVSRYLNGCMAYQQHLSVGSIVVDPKNSVAERINKIVPQVIDALPQAPVMAFHAEFFHTDDDDIVLCEIASRTGGHRIMEIVEKAYGVSIIKSWVRMQCGLPVAIEPNFRTHAGDLLVPPRAGQLQVVPERPPFPWVVDYKPTVTPGQRLHNPRSSGESIASALVVGDTEESVEEHLVQLNEWFLKSVGWQTDARQTASAV